MQTMVITRQGSPIQIVIPTEEIAANVLDFILEPSDIEVVKSKRVDGDLDRVVSELIYKHIKDAIETAHTDSPVKPICSLTGT
jgi:hypothetical protein